jgi:hypothetical protein
VQEKELNVALDTVEGSSNPEVFHAQNGFHPGRRWSIKTIIPGPKILNDDTHPLFLFFQAIQSRHPKIVKLTDKAFDWKGNLIPYWFTIWIEEKVDIHWTYSRADGFDYEIIDYDIGMKNSAARIQSWINEDLDTRHTGHLPISYERLHEIVEFLGTYTTEHRSQHNRSKLKVLHNEQIYNEASE